MDARATKGLLPHQEAGRDASGPAGGASSPDEAGDDTASDSDGGVARRRKRTAFDSPVAARVPPPLSSDDLHRLLRAPLSAVAAARVAAGLWSRFGGVAPPLRCSVLLFALSSTNDDARPHRSTRLNAHAWTAPGLADAWNALVDSSSPRGEGGGDGGGGDG